MAPALLRRGSALLVQTGAPAPVVACCFPDQTCQDLTVEDCQNAGGFAQPIGSDCASIICPILDCPTGEQSCPICPEFDVAIDLTWTMAPGVCSGGQDGEAFGVIPNMMTSCNSVGQPPIVGWFNIQDRVIGTNIPGFCPGSPGCNILAFSTWMTCSTDPVLIDPLPPGAYWIYQLNICHAASPVCDPWCFVAWFQIPRDEGVLCPVGNWTLYNWEGGGQIQSVAGSISTLISTP